MGCMLCPRGCGVDRKTEKGVCGAGETPLLARAMLHFWEEPPISGTKGSGALFFAGCPLGCCYCQNHAISQGQAGEPADPLKLAQVMLGLQAQGAHNINLVSATHFASQAAQGVRSAKEQGLHIPIVYNTSGYETLEAVDALAGVVDVYLPDLKYIRAEPAGRYSGAPDYFEYAGKAIEHMVKQVGSPRFEGGLMKGGVLIRHLVLPGLRREGIAIVDWVWDRFGKDGAALSLMSQYFPTHQSARYPEINRRLTRFEYQSVVDHAAKLGFAYAYCQGAASASEAFVPDFG